MLIFWTFWEDFFNETNTVLTRVSNKTGFSCSVGQSDRCPLILQGQRRQQYKLKTLPQDKSDLNFLRLSHLNILQDKSPSISPINDFPENSSNVQNRAILSCGMSKDRGACPGIFAATLVQGQRDSGTRKLFLSQDKVIAGQGNFFEPSLGNSLSFKSVSIRIEVHCKC